MILPILLTYSLFGVQVQHQGDLAAQAAQEVMALPGMNPFGVFVTIERNRDQRGAHTVHGCLGNWTPTYNAMTASKVVQLAQQLVQDARYRDRRRYQFEVDVDEDVSTVVDVNIMNLPLMPVHRDTGDFVGSSGTFDNNKYGLIVDYGTQRATYLPRVFTNESWSFIKESLLKKANLGNLGNLGNVKEDTIRFFAYRTHSVRFQVVDMLFSVEATQNLLLDVARFYQKHYIDFVPYEYSWEADMAVVDKAQAVRNVGCLYDVLWLQSQFPAVITHDKPVLQNLDFYYQRWHAGVDGAQASIFLIKTYSFLLTFDLAVETSTDIQKRIALLQDSLYAALSSLEPVFSLGEAVSVLAPLVNAATNSGDVEKLFQACDVMRKRLQHLPVEPNTIFELNWQSQSLFHMHELSEWGWPSFVPWLQAFESELTHKVVSVIETMDVSSMETNFLAVAYECMNHLRHYELLRLSKYKVYAELVGRRRGLYGLYYFNKSSTARLDITGHVLNASQ